jgi:hypothetical protein
LKQYGYRCWCLGNRVKRWRGCLGHSKRDRSY